MNTLKSNFLKCCLTIIFLFITNSICNGSPSVIIVGAGVSGIAAAARFLENNITNFTILEAKDRIGGRIHTVPFKSNVVELGAQWCHGEQNNVVFELASKYDLLGYDELEMIYRYSTGKPLDQAFMAELHEIFLSISETASGNISIGEYVSKKYIKIIQDLYKSNPAKLELATEALQLQLDFINAVQGSFSPFNPSAENDFKISEGFFHLNWRNKGYKTILDILTKKYPNPEEQLPIGDKILLNKEVIKINWNDEKQIKVTCSDGSIYRAEHVIVTVSLGVLKHNHETLFSPRLPQEKIIAIENLGFDAVGKVFLHFPNRWWDNNNSKTLDVFPLLWNEEDKKLFLNSSESDNSWMLNFDAVFKMKENPNVLMAWLTGTSIPQIELMSDDVLIEGLMFVMHKFFDKFYDNITNPDAITRQGWYTDPHFRGTYSYQTVKARQVEESPEFILSKPLDGMKVLFAGEATNPIQFSTVHGALDTGRREAKRIIDLYQENILV